MLVSVVLWILFSIAPGFITSTLTLLPALAFTALWILHVVWYVRYALADVRALYAHRSKQLAGTEIVSEAFEATLGAVYQSLPPLIATSMLGFAAKTPWCNCYYDKDCSGFYFCKWSAKCNNVRKGKRNCPSHDVRGSCDGICTFMRYMPADISLTELADVIDAYFTIFHNAASGGSVSGDPPHAAIAAVDARFSENCQYELKGLVFSALDVVLGWDLIYGHAADLDPNHAFDDAFIGHIADETATPAIIDAARRAFSEAILAEDPDKVAGPLEEFWNTYTDYAPAHTGRCYPHGHTVYRSAIDCQVAQFRSMVAALLGARNDGISSSI